MQEDSFIYLYNWVSVFKWFDKIQDIFATSGLDQGCVFISAVQRIDV